MNEVLRFVLDTLYPPKCMLCGRLLPSSELLLCGRCGDLPEYEGVPPKIRWFDGCAVPFFYEAPIRDAILRFKFHGMQSYARQFARWMATPVRDKLAGRWDMISWVPCGPRRRRTRGFDQAQLLAEALAAELGTEAVPTLRKIRNNRPQSRTVGEARRRANVLGAYEALQPERYAGKRVLLVDDVITTGATLSECGKVLRMAGVGGLVCAAIAAACHDNNE